MRVMSQTNGVIGLCYEVIRLCLDVMSQTTEVIRLCRILKVFQGISGVLHLGIAASMPASKVRVAGRYAQKIKDLKA